MRFYNKIVFSAIVMAILLLSFPTQSVSAASMTRTVGSGIITLEYRDTTSFDPTPTPTAFFDNSKFRPGETSTLTITDFNGNMDPTTNDSITATYASQLYALNETEANNGIFTQQVVLVGNGQMIYTPDPPESARATVTLDLESETDVILSDVQVIDSSDISDIKPVTHGLEVLLEDESALTDGTPITVTMSFVNGLFTPDEFEILCNLKLYYKSSDETGWEQAGAADTEDECNNFRITSDPVTEFGNPVTTGKFLIAFNVGGGGGGGGGLIRPGLVLNLLAGLTGGAGIDRSPPSLNYGTPTNTQDGFGGILVTDDNNNSFPLVINNKGYYLPAFSTSIDPVKVNTGQDVSLTLTFLESTGVEHVALHFVNENYDEMTNDDAVITFDKDSVTKSDPQGILADDITFSKSKDGNKYSFNFGFSFDEPANRHLMITAWDNNKNSGNTKVFNAFTVSGNSIPDEGVGHMIYLDLGAYFITTNGILKAGEMTTVAQPVIEYDYPDLVGRTERHDGIIYDQIANEKTRASQVMISKFNLDTETFVANDEVKPYDDSRRAAELSLSSVGHKIRDFTLTPEENKELIKELSWQEHLRAQKILDSILSSSKYHK